MDPNKIIDGCGGTSAVARACEITTGAVSQWRDNGIPKPWLKFLRLAHPEVFAPEESSEGEATLPHG